MDGFVGNNSARLSTQSLLPPMFSPKCLSFWYHMFGKDPANFTLLTSDQREPDYSSEQLLWIKRQPQSNNWVKAEVNMPYQSVPFYLIFKASLMPQSEDNIGLDDIVFAEGECPRTSICDFEVSS